VNPKINPENKFSLELFLFMVYKNGRSENQTKNAQNVKLKLKPVRNPDKLTSSRLII
jgi:hypothetical protein